MIKVIALLFSNTSRMVRLSILTILSLLVLSQAQILAIDYGTQFVKAALVHTGAGKSFSIVENSKSQRKFVNAVRFLLSSLASTMRNDFMKQTRSPKGHEDHLIASFSHDYSSICTIILLSSTELRRSSF